MVVGFDCSIKQGQTATVFDYQITYKGPQQIELEKTDREKYAHVIELKRDGSNWEARPIIFWSDFNNRESAFFEPGIVYTPTKDIYVSPKGLEQAGGNPTIAMKKGDRQRFRSTARSPSSPRGTSPCRR